MPRLSDLKIDEVSLVRKGANQHARVAIAKSADEPGGTVELFDDQGSPLDSEDLEHGQVVYDGNGQAYQYDAEAEVDEGTHEGEYDEAEDPEEFGKAAYLAVGGKKIAMGGAAKKAAFGAKRGGQAARYGATRARNTASVVGGDLRAGASTLRTGATNRARGASNAVAGAAGNVAGRTVGAGRNAASAVQGFNPSRDTRIRAGIGAGGLIAGGAAGYGGSQVRKSLGQELQEEFSKSLTEDDKDAVISKAFGALELLQAQAEEAQAIAEDEREARRDAEFYEVAKSYSVLPVDTEELAEVFKACADNLAPEHVAVIAKCFNFATEAIFEEQGAIGGGSNSDIMAQVEAAASGSVRKSHGDPSQFVVDTFGSDPELYDQYLAETGR